MKKNNKALALGKKIFILKKYKALKTFMKFLKRIGFLAACVAFSGHGMDKKDLYPELKLLGKANMSEGSADLYQDLTIKQKANLILEFYKEKSKILVNNDLIHHAMMQVECSKPYLEYIEFAEHKYLFECFKSLLSERCIENVYTDKLMTVFFALKAFVPLENTYTIVDFNDIVNQLQSRV